jgi:exodeoxyribonuclease VII large subunit
MLLSEKEKVENLEKRIAILSPTNKILNSRQEISNLYDKVVNLISMKMNDEKLKISVLSSKLNALSPLSVLSRGYSISYNNDIPVMSVKDVKTDDNIKVRVADGEIFATVNDVKGN